MRDSPSLRWLPVALCLASGTALAQPPVPSAADLALFAARRYPQPVRVGQLIHRRVLQPLESRPILGHVEAVVRQPNGQIAIVIHYGGFLGLGGRLIAVPADAMALLGDEMEVLDFAPLQLDAFPTFLAGTAIPIPDDARIEVSLARPSH